LFNLACPPKEQSPRFFIDGIGICTPGNLTTVASAVKSGKSAYVGAMIAAALAEGSTKVDCLGVTSCNPEGLGLIHFDTEQSPRDHYELVVRALRRAQIESPLEWLRSYCLTGFPYSDIRRSLALAIQAAADRFGGIHSVLIDGVADLVADVNDQTEANELVTELHRIAIDFECPILGVIHLNPGQADKTRGHLGSQLERKAETNLRLEKKNEITRVWSEKNRRAPILKEQGPCFCWSNEHRTHVRIENPVTSRGLDKQQQLHELARSVFESAGSSSLTWTEVIQGICKKNEVSESGARKKLEALVAHSLVRKTANGCYEMA
jgi:hypothetical protein